MCVQIQALKGMKKTKDWTALFMLMLLEISTAQNNSGMLTLLLKSITNMIFLHYDIQYVTINIIHKAY